ncbi:succinate dehydrogenase, cytochrome b556 subunit [Acidiphilium sp.]|uniref:succinate dehydrogenase, cytochrome b556 subunit n=1 Tax=Acidiphilium sp. TaxID=527 RepID=UPI003D07C732
MSTDPLKLVITMQDMREALMQGRNTAGKLVQRPLSPHLQVYKPQISSALSIFHRLTGVALALGAMLLSLWLAAAATSPGAFADAQALLDSIIGMIVLFGFTLALFYHFCNGIRHLLWDAGYGFDLPTMHRTGYAVMIASVGLTVVFWIIGLVIL